MADNINNNNFYNGGQEWNLFLAGLIANLQQSGSSASQISEILELVKALPNSLSEFQNIVQKMRVDEAKNVASAIRAMNKKLDALRQNASVDSSAQIAQLQKSLDSFDGVLTGKLQPTEALLKEIKTILLAVNAQQEATDKKVDEVLGLLRSNPAGASHTPAGDGSPVGTPAGDGKPAETPAGDGKPVEPVAPAGGDGKPVDPVAPVGGDGKPVEPVAPAGGVGKPAGDGKPVDPPAPAGGDGKPAGDGKPVDPPAGGGVPRPDEPVKKGKLKRIKFIHKSIAYTKMLAEAKEPWYRRVATFAIKHPVLSVVAGAGLGLGLFAATCGIAALAGGTSILTAANMLLPSVPGLMGAGAIAGGAVSLASNTLPKGKWGLFAQCSKLFNKVRQIDSTKQWVASFEAEQEKAKKEARARMKKSKGLIGAWHKFRMNLHKGSERLAKRVGVVLSEAMFDTTKKALETKDKLNDKEIKSGKTLAYAGFLQKKRRLQEKLLSGKIDEAEYDDRLAEYDEDYADRTGGAPGLAKADTARHYTLDAEAVEAIKRNNSPAFDEWKHDLEKRHPEAIVSRKVGVLHGVKEEDVPAMVEEGKKKLKEAGLNPDEIYYETEDMPEDEAESSK